MIWALLLASKKQALDHWWLRFCGAPMVVHAPSSQEAHPGDTVLAMDLSITPRNDDLRLSGA
jgi:hypothetical protein